MMMTSGRSVPGGLPLGEGGGGEKGGGGRKFPATSAPERRSEGEVEGDGEVGGGGPWRRPDSTLAQPAGASVTWVSRSLLVPEQPVPTTHTCSGLPACALVTITVAGAPW